MTGVGVAVGIGIGVGVGTAVAVNTGVGTAVGVGVGVGTAVAVGTGVGVGAGAVTVISRLQKSRVPVFPAPSSLTTNVQVPAACLFKKKFATDEFTESYEAGPSQRSRPRFMTVNLVPSG